MPLPLVLLAFTPEMAAATVNLVGVLGLTNYASKMSPAKPSKASSDAKGKAKSSSAAGANDPVCKGCKDPDEKEKNNKDPRKDKDGNPLRTKGTRTASKTMYQTKGLSPGDRGYVRVDVENPSPGNVSGNIHAQFDSSSKYYYDYVSGGWTPSAGSPGLTNSQQSLLNSPQVQSAVGKGLQFLNP